MPRRCCWQGQGQHSGAGQRLRVVRWYLHGALLEGLLLLLVLVLPGVVRLASLLSLLLLLLHVQGLAPGPPLQGRVCCCHPALQRRCLMGALQVEHQPPLLLVVGQASHHSCHPLLLQVLA